MYISCVCGVYVYVYVCVYPLYGLNTQWQIQKGLVNRHGERAGGVKHARGVMTVVALAGHQHALQVASLGQREH